jgi:aldehyde dehydrogenase (NAD+)
MTTSNDPVKGSGEIRMLIAGKLVNARSGKTLDNINPATEEVLGQVADAGHEDMEESIAAARQAFDGHSSTPRSARH